MAKNPIKIKDPDQRLEAIREAMQDIDLRIPAQREKFFALAEAELATCDELTTAEQFINYARGAHATAGEFLVSRDENIRKAAAKGASTREIAAGIGGLTHAGVAKIINRG